MSLFDMQSSLTLNLWSFSYIFPILIMKITIVPRPLPPPARSSRSGSPLYAVSLVGNVSRPSSPLLPSHSLSIPSNLCSCLKARIECSSPSHSLLRFRGICWPDHPILHFLSPSNCLRIIRPCFRFFRKTHSSSNSTFWDWEVKPAKEWKFQPSGVSWSWINLCLKP